MSDMSLEIMLQTSVLVISRTPALINRLLDSLDGAYTGAPETIEILISWNGTNDDEKEIRQGRLNWSVSQRVPYHFAGNMNALAKQAKGEYLIFSNDDLIADPGSVDAAIGCLKSKEEVGIVGAMLRTSTGQLAHAGIHFTSKGSPYHQLEHFVDAEHPALQRKRTVPAVTGAFFAMRRDDFLNLELAETFNVCGEDVLLCLQTRSILNKDVYLHPEVRGIHDAESTRISQEGQQGNDQDMQRMRAGWKEMLQHASTKELLVELTATQDEAESLREVCSRNTSELTSLRRERENLERSNKKNELETALLTKTLLEQELLQSENKRLKNRIQQLENSLERIKK